MLIANGKLGTNNNPIKLETYFVIVAKGEAK